MLNVIYTICHDSILSKVIAYDKFLQVNQKLFVENLMVFFMKKQQQFYLILLILNRQIFYKVELKYLYVRKGQEAAGRVDFFDHMHSN